MASSTRGLNITANVTTSVHVDQKGRTSKNFDNSPSNSEISHITSLEYDSIQTMSLLLRSWKKHALHTSWAICRWLQHSGIWKIIKFSKRLKNTYNVACWTVCLFHRRQQWQRIHAYSHECPASSQNGRVRFFRLGTRKLEGKNIQKSLKHLLMNRSSTLTDQRKKAWTEKSLKHQILYSKSFVKSTHYHLISISISDRSPAHEILFFARGTEWFWQYSHVWIPDEISPLLKVVIRIMIIAILQWCCFAFAIGEGNMKLIM